MSLAALAFLMTGVLLNAGAQLLLKAGHQRARRAHAHARQLDRHAVPDGDAGPLRAGRRSATLLSFFVWILGLSRVPVSVAYPLLSVGYIVNAIAAHYLFGEAVTMTRWLGIGFIVIGVSLVARS